MPIGSITWARLAGDTIHPEDDRYKINASPNCFKLLGKGRASDYFLEDTLHKPKYRFRTKEEMIQIGRWTKSSNIDGGAPDFWSSSGVMNEYLGIELTEDQEKYFLLAKQYQEKAGTASFSFNVGPWTFRTWNCIEIDTKEKFQEMKPQSLELVESLVQTKETKDSVPTSSTMNFEYQSKYRFKVKEEFIKDEKWITTRSGGIPNSWSPQMDVYLGKKITKELDLTLIGLENSKSVRKVKYNGWTFDVQDFIESSIIPDYKLLEKERDSVSRSTASMKYQETKEKITKTRITTDGVTVESTINITI
jgi:hypothetical protein